MPGKKVRLEYVFPDDLQSHFISNIIVQHEAENFIISYFEVWPPSILGETEEEKQQQIDALETIEARCVARLVVTPSRMMSFLRVMQDNIDTFDQNSAEGPVEKDAD